MEKTPKMDGQQITKAQAGDLCQREMRIDQAGKAIYCHKPAAMRINGVKLCAKHANEYMQAAAVRMQTK